MNAIMRWFDDPRSARFGLSLVHFLWQGALLGAAAGFLMTWMRGASSHRRYDVLLTTLLAMAIAPVVTFLLLPAPRNAESTASPVAALLPLSTSETLASPSTAAPIQRVPATTIHGPLDQRAKTDLVADASKTRFESRINAVWQWIAGHLSWFVAAWALGVCLSSVRLMIGLLGAHRVCRVGVVPAPEACRALGGELAARLGLRRMAVVCESALVNVPVVVGWLRPIVLLPASIITGLPEPELRAILAHELAHLRRHDYLVNLLQSFVETLLFCHPMVWWRYNQMLWMGS